MAESLVLRKRSENQSFVFYLDFPNFHKVTVKMVIKACRRVNKSHFQNVLQNTQK